MSKHAGLFVCIIILLSSTNLFAVESTITITSIGDNFIKQTHQNENEGSKGYFRIQNANISHALVRFSQNDLITAVGSKHVITASLELYIETNFNNWNTGRLVDAHRLTADWSELTSTWACPADSNLSNSSPDCPTTWNGGTYFEEPTDSVLHLNQETGWKSFNVTTDVLDFVSGASTNYGWLLKKNIDSDSGSVDYTSVQGSVSYRPRLVLTLDDYAPETTFHISNVEPFIFEATGTNTTIMISGLGFTSGMSVIVDDVSIPYTLINENLFSITLNYTTSGRHFLVVENTVGVSSGWPNGLFAVKSGEIVTGRWVNEAAAGSIIDIYAIGPKFDEDTKVYIDSENKQYVPSVPTTSMVLAESTFVSENHVEIEIPAGVQGNLALYVDNSIESDIYKTEAASLVSQLSPVNLPETSSCTVTDLLVEKSYSNWRRFKAVTSGCCNKTCAPQKFFGLQYYIDGVTYSEQICGDDAPITWSSEWVFNAGQSHSIGARVVEYSYFIDHGDRVKVCSKFSPRKTKNLGVVQRHSSDTDSDGILDQLESRLYTDASPKLVINVSEGGETPHTTTVRIGPGVTHTAAPQMDIVLSFNALYYADDGCFPVPGHDFDTEPFGYLVDGGTTPGSNSGWQIVKSKAIAHDGTSFQKTTTASGIRRYIYVAANKNANFLNVCNYSCNRCDDNGTQLTPIKHDVGNGTQWKNCGHSNHLQNGQYLVPSKWGRILRQFTMRSWNPFPN